MGTVKRNGHKTLKVIGDLVPDSLNANKGTPRGQQMVEDSLRNYGAGRSILADKKGRIIAGNKTLQSASDINLPIRVVESDGKSLIVVQRTDLDLNDPRARELAIADNRAGEVGLEWNAEILAQLKDEGVELSGMFTEKELAAILPQGESKDAEPQIDKAKELQQKWQVATGEVIQIGRHRLMCGDSVSKADVAALMLSDRATMIFTDPPYNVDVAGGSHDPTDIANYRSGGTIANDKVSDAEFHRFLIAALSNAFVYAIPGAPIYICFSDSELENFIATFKQSGFYYSGLIIWRKQQFVFGRKDYHSQHEPILYGWKLGAAHYFCDDHTQSTVWDIDRPMRSAKEHPTQKPTELVVRAIRNSSLPSGIVYDPFVGSGTTLVAAENLNRTCYAMEISPEYCAVVLERMTTAFPHLKIKREAISRAA